MEEPHLWVFSQYKKLAYFVVNAVAGCFKLKLGIIFFFTYDL